MKETFKFKQPEPECLTVRNILSRDDVATCGAFIARFGGYEEEHIFILCLRQTTDVQAVCLHNGSLWNGGDRLIFVRACTVEAIAT